MRVKVALHMKEGCDNEKEQCNTVVNKSSKTAFVSVGPALLHTQFHCCSPYEL